MPLSTIVREKGRSYALQTFVLLWCRSSFLSLSFQLFKVSNCADRNEWKKQEWNTKRKGPCSSCRCGRLCWLQYQNLLNRKESVVMHGGEQNQKTTGLEMWQPKTHDHLLVSIRLLFVLHLSLLLLYFSVQILDKMNIGDVLRICLHAPMCPQQSSTPQYKQILAQNPSLRVVGGQLLRHGQRTRTVSWQGKSCTPDVGTRWKATSICECMMRVVSNKSHKRGNFMFIGGINFALHSAGKAPLYLNKQSKGRGNNYSPQHN